MMPCNANPMEILEEYFCPITQEIMTDPVVAADGHTYQRKNITEWLVRGKRHSPVNGTPLANTILHDNIDFKNVIQKLIVNRPEVVMEGGVEPNLDLCINERETTISEFLEKTEKIKIQSNEVIQSQRIEIEKLKRINKSLNEEYLKLKEEQEMLKNTFQIIKGKTAKIN